MSRIEYPTNCYTCKHMLSSDQEKNDHHEEYHPNETILLQYPDALWLDKVNGVLVFQKQGEMMFIKELNAVVKTLDNPIIAMPMQDFRKVINAITKLFGLDDLGLGGLFG